MSAMLFGVVVVLTGIVILREGIGWVSKVRDRYRIRHELQQFEPPGKRSRCA